VQNGLSSALYDEMTNVAQRAEAFAIAEHKTDRRDEVKTFAIWVDVMLSKAKYLVFQFLAY
jgi:hypothetical protein